MVTGGRRSDREKKKESGTGVTWVRPIVRLFPRGLFDLDRAETKGSDRKCP